jgi:hypothetical protein
LPFAAENIHLRSQIDKLKADLQKALTFFEWPHHKSSTFFNVQENARRKMANTVARILNELDSRTEIFHGCTSVKLELTRKDELTVVIPFLRNSEPDEALDRCDLKCIDLAIGYEKTNGDLLTYEEWKEYSTQLSLRMKDQELMTDPQYHEMRKLVLYFLKRANLISCCYIPPLHSVINQRALMDDWTKSTLGLRPVQGEFVAVLVKGHGAIAETYKYIRSNNIIGAEFDLKKMLTYGLTIFWDIFPKNAQGDKIFVLRITADGADLTNLNQYTTASIRWLIPNLIPFLAEWLLKTVKCDENRPNLNTFFRSIFALCEEINRNGFHFIAPGETEASLLKVRFILCPDAKMLNLCCGMQSHTAECFCAQCLITALLFLLDPLRNSLIPGLGPPKPFVLDPLWLNTKNVANDTLHFFLRFCDCFLGETLALCNSDVRGIKKEIHAKNIKDFCGVSIIFYGEINKVAGDSKSKPLWSSVNGPNFRKLLYKFNLSTVYDGRELFLANLMWGLFALVTFGIERRTGSIGSFSGQQFRILVFLLVDTFEQLYERNPTARYVLPLSQVLRDPPLPGILTPTPTPLYQVHFATDHMPFMKDELSKLGLDLMDLCCSPSEYLQKWARQSLRRASNGHSDALVQVASLFSRKLQHVVQSGKSFLVDAKNQDRNKNKEIKRHCDLFSGDHKCITEDKRKYIFARFKKMQEDGVLKEADIVGFDISTLFLSCPFCTILGLKLKSKVSEKRPTTCLVGGLGLGDACDSDESDESYKTDESSEESDYASDFEDD